MHLAWINAPAQHHLPIHSTKGISIVTQELGLKFIFIVCQQVSVVFQILCIKVLKCRKELLESSTVVYSLKIIGSYACLFTMENWYLSLQMKQGVVGILPCYKNRCSICVYLCCPSFWLWFLLSFLLSLGPGQKLPKIAKILHRQKITKIANIQQHHSTHRV